MMKPIRCGVLVGAAVLALAGPAAAQSFPVECAVRDVQIITQLERHGEVQDVPGEILSEAFWTMKRARDACYEGRMMVGMAIYDSIFKTSLAGLAELR